MTETTTDRPDKTVGLEINPVTDGYIIYQADRDRVHYLNQTAAIVFELCNGHNAIDDLARMVQQAWQLTSPPTEDVMECLDALRQEGLIR
ncbi:MAG: PqqD family protein [Acetobacteraceae bacterium]|jgi:hypothetical protein